MVSLPQKLSWRVLLTWLIVGIYTLIIGIGTMTAQNTSLNNALHKILPIWPEVGVSEIKTETITVRKGEYADAQKKTIKMHTGGQTVSLTDDGVNHFSVRAEYERGADQIYFDTDIDSDKLLTIDAKRVLNEVDLPLQPRALASYDLTLGTLDIPTYLDLTLLSGKVDMTFENEPIQTLHFYTESADALITFAEGSVPRETIVLESDGGETILQLPDINATIEYRLDEDAKLEVNEGEAIRHEEGVLEIKSRTNNDPPLPITVISVEGDIIITSQLLED